MSPPPVAATSSRRAGWRVVGVLVLVVVLAYLGSLDGPFVFDDVASIQNNPSLRRPLDLPAVLQPALGNGATVDGRPLLNLSFALNHAWSGTSVLGYHTTNLLIHAAAGLLLFGVMRRTLEHSSLVAKATALPLSAAVAALWLLHPLQTESVTYLVQRAESLAGLWYLLVLYAFVRGVADGNGRAWLGVSVAACLLGGATKETLATAPLVVLLYDRTFVAGSFTEAWRRRWGYYLALAATWILIGWLVVTAAGRGGTAGFGSSVSAWHYALTQCRAHLLYLKLVVWPDPLVFDYGTATASRLGEVWWQALLMVTLVGATLGALVRRPAWGFAGAVYLLLLAPSSSVVPVVSQTMAEHRMYLALAIPVTLVVLGLQRWLGRAGFVVLAIFVLVAGVLTAARNRDYRSALALWSDTVAKHPGNVRAQLELGQALAGAGQTEEALAHFREASRLDPLAAAPRYNAGVMLALRGQPAAAAVEYAEAIRLQPDYADAHNNLGALQRDAGRAEEAVRSFQEAIRLQPALALAHTNLASALLDLGRPAEALVAATEGARLAPHDAEALATWADTLAASGRLAEAAEKYATVLQLKPDYAQIHNNRASVLMQLGRMDEAVFHYRAALRLKPDYAFARINLTRLLLHLRRRDEAIQLLQTLARAVPGDRNIPAELAQVRALAP